MEYKPSYFFDEVREGFYVSGMVKRAWAAQLEVLEFIDEVCKKYNIKWFADCGSLLGAVRHGGYIPWDDDFDICMLRDDYIRFNEVIQDELPENFVWLNLNNEEETYYEMMTRITNSHRLNFDSDFLEKYHDFPYAAGVDIFPIDYLADDEETEEQRRELCTYIASIAENLEDDDSNLDIFREYIPDIEAVCDIQIDYSKCVKRQLYQVMEMVFALYSEQHGEYVALMPYWVHHHNHKYRTEYFDKIIMLPYETIQLPVPAAYDAVLKIEYGDYMKIYKGGGVHGYPFFENQTEHLKEQLSTYPFEYIYKKEDLENPNREQKVSVRQNAIDFIGLIGEAHNALIAMISAGMYDTVYNIIQSCQNSAIQVGTMIEEKFGEGNITVSVLEEYCELVYQIFELVQEAEAKGSLINVAELKQYLAEETAKLSESIDENVYDRREILFMPVRATDWKAFESVWRAAKEEEDTDVVVMPVPYYSRTAFGELGKEFYDGELFPEYVDITDYRSYDIRRQHPDVIYVQIPYDQCNYTMSIAPEYYTSNIKRYTDKMVYIPWFKLDEMNADSDKARKTMDYFCRVPGLFHADEVIVQSEGMRQEYITYLTNFAGEDTKEIWEKKIVAGGSPLDDAESNEAAKEECIKGLPEAWKDILYGYDGELKKVVLYNTTVASVIQYGEKAIDKIRRSLQIFKQHKDKIALLWRPHPVLRQVIIATVPDKVAEYDEIVSIYKEEVWGIYDDISDDETILTICDAYYGDADCMARKCEERKKPVMIQDVRMIFD